jgi:ketosteroid isomerase-like protein
VVLVVDALLKPGTFKGRQAVGEWFADWFRAFEPDYHFDIEEAQDLGDAVFLFATCYGHGRTSGVEVQGQTGFLYRLRGGKIVRVELYPSRADALEAAGLRE